MVVTGIWHLIFPFSGGMARGLRPAPSTITDRAHGMFIPSRAVASPNGELVLPSRPGKPRWRRRRHPGLAWAGVDPRPGRVAAGHLTGRGRCAGGTSALAGTRSGALPLTRVW